MKSLAQRFLLIFGIILACVIHVNAQNVGIGNPNPKAKLDVYGNIKLGSTSADSSDALRGTIRFLSTEFEGYTGSTWIPLHTLWTKAQTTDIYRPSGKVGIAWSNPGGQFGISSTLAADTNIAIQRTQIGVILKGIDNTDPTNPFLIELDRNAGKCYTRMGVSTNYPNQFTLHQNGRIGFGTAKPCELAGLTSGLIEFADNDPLHSDWVMRVGNDVSYGYPALIFAKSAGSIDAPTPVVAGHLLGGLLFTGYDGTQFGRAAEIRGEADGDGTVNNMPGRITFHTVQSGTLNTQYERMRIDNKGYVGIGTQSPNGIFEVQGGTSTSGSGSSIRIYAQSGIASGNSNGGSIYLVPGTGNGSGNCGNIGIGTASPSGYLDIRPPTSTAPSGNGKSFYFTAQNGAASGNTNGGSFYFVTGTSNGTGTRGGLGINLAGTPVEALDINGRINLQQTTAPTSTANKIYNVGGTLYWNGSPIGGSSGVTSVTGTSPIASSGGTTPAISIANAAADGTTKGAATFTAADFNDATGLISLDYTNGQAANTTTKGYLSSTDWNTFNNKLTSTLASTNIFVGNGSNVATAVAMSGDATLSNAGALTIANNAITTAKIANNAVDGTKIALGSDAQGDIMYYNGTDYVRLGAGTSGYFLKTQGAGANPVWAAASGSLPSGTSGQTLRHDGTNWTANSLLYNNGTSIGINTTSPGATYALDVAGNVNINSTSAPSVLTMNAHNSTTNIAKITFVNTAASGDFQISGDGGDIFWQGGGGRNLQMAAYHGIDLMGGRVSGPAPTFMTGTSSAFNTRILNTTNAVGLVVQANSTQTNNLQEWRNSSGTGLSAVDKSGWLGILNTAPASPLSVGANSEFQVNSSGNIVKLNNVTTNFPSSQGAANTYLKNDGSGNLSWAAGGNTQIYKSTDESVTSSTSIQDDDELQFSTSSGVKYGFRILAFFTSASSTPDFKSQLIQSGGSLNSSVCRYLGSDGVSATVNPKAYAQAGSTLTILSLQTQNIAANTVGSVVMEGTVDVATGGTIIFQWAQNSSNNNATKVLKGSSLTYWVIQ